MGAWNFGDHVEGLDVDGRPVREMNPESCREFS